MPTTTTFAEEAMIVALPPRSAPRAKAHHSTSVSSPPPDEATISATIGLTDATNGMLSMTAEGTTEPKTRAIAVPCRSPPVASAAISPRSPITPVRTIAPTMTNSPVKKARVSHSTSLTTSPGSIREIPSSNSPPLMATTEGSSPSQVCSTKQAITATITTPLTPSSRTSLMAPRGLSSMTDAARSGS